MKLTLIASAFILIASAFTTFIVIYFTKKRVDGFTTSYDHVARLPHPYRAHHALQNWEMCVENGYPKDFCMQMPYPNAAVTQ